MYHIMDSDVQIDTDIQLEPFSCSAATSKSVCYLFSGAVCCQGVLPLKTSLPWPGLELEPETSHNHGS